MSGAERAMAETQPTTADRNPMPSPGAGAREVERRSPLSMSRLCRSPVLPLALCTFVLYAYFYGGATWNANARLDAIFAMVEPGTEDTGTFHIDRFITDPPAAVNTGDWARARHSGRWHYYSNKAPGTTVTGVPFYLVLSRVEMVLGLDLQDPTVSLVNAYLINLFVSVLPACFGVAAMYGIVRAGRGSRPQGLAIAAVLAFGSLLFPLSTKLIGHGPALAWVALALLLLESGPADGRGALAASGFFMGMAVLTEYITAVTLLSVLVYVAWSGRRRLVWFVLGGIPPLVLYLVYHQVCFGRAVTVATAFSNPLFLRTGMAAGQFGLFSPVVFCKLLFSPYRGLFLYSPVFLLSLPAIWLWIRDNPRRPLPWLCAANMAAYVLLLACFAGWHGGATPGPRYLTASLPFWVLPLHRIMKVKRLRPVLALLAAVSVMNMLVVAAVSPTVPEEWTNPLLGHLYPMFWRGELTPWEFPIKLHFDLAAEQRDWAAFNWGERMGLHGLVSLLPGLAIGAACFSWAWRRAHRPD